MGDPADDDRPPEELALEDHLRVFFTDSTLWPVLVAAIGAGTTLGAAMLLWSVRDRNLFALAAVAVLVVVSGDAVVREVRRRRIGPVGGTILGLWVLAAAVAWAAGRSGLL